MLAPPSRRSSPMKHNVWLSSLVVAFAACSGGAGSAPIPATASRAGAPAAGQAQQLKALYAEYWEENLKLNPIQATMVGDARYNDQLPNTLSPEYRARVKDFRQRFLDRAKAIGGDGLTGQDRLSYDIFVRDQASELEGYDYPQHLVPINQFNNVANLIAILGSGKGAQPFKTVQDYEAWLRRAGQVPVVFDQAIANMRVGMAQGIVRPKILMEKVLPQLDQHIVKKASDSTLWGPIAAMPAGFSASDKQRLTAEYTALIENTIVPAYRKLRAFIADEYLPKCSDAVGLGALPNGAAWYAYRVRESTTTDLSPEQIHQLGLAEIARIHGEMKAVMDQVGFKGELKEYFASLKANPAMYFKTEDELLAAYREFRRTVEPLLPKLFEVKPKADFEIRPVEAFRAASASGGSYQAPSEDGSRLGIFYVNTFDLKARPRWALESLYLHEATPGHHFQIALQRELEDLPRFRRFTGETGFNEGWGLYAESLGKELGVYTEPAMYFGALDAELWRAIRLVADTGIHAKGWTRKRVLDFMYANSPVEPTRAIAEAERFMAIPGQALAYKIGQLKIRELRTRAEKALGTRFDVRAFHTEVLKDGSVPLAILEGKIDRWIGERKAGPAAAR
ncbi:MAG: DUF885 family protein [Deltaproteobacteria bacterium]|nr:MAG: DUF885 family protein [Deltaproteobacteria bacterium]